MIFQANKDLYGGIFQISPWFSSSNTPFLNDFPINFDEKPEMINCLARVRPVHLDTYLFGLLDWVKIQLYPKHPLTISGFLAKYIILLIHCPLFRIEKTYGHDMSMLV